MPSLGPEGWTAIALIVAMLFSGMLGRVWRPLRKTVAAIDVVAGRAARYPGDPEEKPGLAERLDTIDRNMRQLQTKVDAVETKVDNLETGCSDDE